MIKITNEQAMLLRSPIIKDLFEKRTFPAVDGFKLNKLIRDAVKETQLYEDTIKTIIEKKRESGEIQMLEDGGIELTEDIQKELQDLSQIEVELSGNKLKVTDDWPSLTLAEQGLLLPLLEL